MSKPKEWDNWNEPVKFTPEALRRLKEIIEKGQPEIVFDLDDEGEEWKR